jgi:deoxyribose-phosphate aldolase
LRIAVKVVQRLKKDPLPNNFLQTGKCNMSTYVKPPIQGLPEGFSSLIERAKLANATYETAKYALDNFEVNAIASDDTDLARATSYACNGHNAKSICVPGKSIAAVFNELKEAESATKISTAIYYPSGRRKPARISDTEYAYPAPIVTLREIKKAVETGAGIIDIVFDHEDFNQGKRHGLDHLSKIIPYRKGDFQLKVTVETPAFKEYGALMRACERIIVNHLKDGDIIRTATGAFGNNGDRPRTTLEEATVLLFAVVKSGNRDIGVEISHGPENSQECAQFIELARLIGGDEFLAAGKLTFSDPELQKSLLMEIKRQKTGPVAPIAFELAN